MENQSIVCECYDEGCLKHNGFSGCKEKASIEIERIDMVDSGSMVFCVDCADDAFESGLFRYLGTVN